MTTDLAWDSRGAHFREAVSLPSSRCAAAPRAIRDAILADVGEVDCERVTRLQLNRMTFLSVQGRGLTSVKPGDFANLVELRSLRLTTERDRRVPSGDL